MAVAFSPIGPAARSSSLRHVSLLVPLVVDMTRLLKFICETVAVSAVDIHRQEKYQGAREKANHDHMAPIHFCCVKFTSAFHENETTAKSFKDVLQRTRAYCP